MIAGADDFVAIAAWGTQKRKWLEGFLDLSDGIPSHDRFNAILGALRPGEFERCLLSWFGDDFARVKVRWHETRERGHGRDEHRSYFVCTAPDSLPDRARWRKLTAIGVAIGETVRGGREAAEVRCYILSRKLSAKRFGEAVRSHWAIENRLHWQLDVTFVEDQCRVREGHADANLSSLRRTALSLLKNNRTSKVGIKNKRLTAAWNDDYLAETLFGR